MGNLQGGGRHGPMTSYPSHHFTTHTTTHTHVPRVSVDIQLPSSKPDGVSIAVFGHAGAGKSALINAIRQKAARDHGAATVGVGAGVEQCQAFKWHEHRDITIWDIPTRADVPIATYREWLQ